MSDNLLQTFHPILAEWFAKSFGSPTAVQTAAWQAIAAGGHTLIAAPTGSGKTLAALLPCLDRVLKEGERANGVKVLYVTPLKALNNDIHHHVVGFADDMNRLAEERGLEWEGLRVGIRTGDTPQSTRASMLRQPPDVLVTTPESLYLLLTSAKGRGMLRTVGQVIVDEIHDLAADKRGVHLSLTLERLAEWRGGNPQRIGVSATQKPMERVARFLGGWEDDGAYRPVQIVESEMERRLEVRVTMPDRAAGARGRGDERFWQPILDRLMTLMQGSATALVFVNSRRLCERLTLRLNEHAGFEFARSHHGSVSREKRLEVERLLKAGELRCLVATSSLELGIDVGHVDAVIQVDSPHAAAAGIQRIGRAGHAVGGTSRGTLLVRSRGELPEAAVLARAIAARDIEEIRVPRHSLDVLSQQIVAMTATEDWEVGRLARLLARSDCYRGFPQARLEAVLQVLAGLYPFARPLIGWNRETGVLHRLPVTPMAAVMGAGTIPQSSGYPVHHAESKQHIGELDEEFVHETRVGDVFQLGTSSWMVQDIRHDRIYVTESRNSFSEIPFWRAEAPGRSYELGIRVGTFLAEISDRIDAGAYPETQDWLETEYLLDANAADQLITLVKGQRAVCPLPTSRRVVVESFADDANQRHIVIHSLFGRKVNRTWLLALQLKLERELPVRFYSNARDNGIELVFKQWEPSWLPLIGSLGASELEALLLDAIPGSPLLGIHFRRIAEVSLLLSRSFTRVPAWKKRLRSEELLRDALPYAERFPFLHEAMRESMEEALAVGPLMEILEGVAAGRIQWAVRETAFPSPFAAQFLFDYVNTALYESDTLSKDLQVQLLDVNRQLAAEVFGEHGIRRMIGPEAVAEERDRLEREPEGSVRNAEDMYRLLKERGDLTESEIELAAGVPVSSWLRELRHSGRITGIALGGEQRWICSDERETYGAFPEDPAAAAFVITRFIDHRIAFVPDDLTRRYGLSERESNALIGDWRERGIIEHAPFAEPGKEELFTSAKVASRMIRYSIREFRRRAEPVPAARYMGLLAADQGIYADTRLTGEGGLRGVISRLQGMFLPLSHWETIVFPSRLADYRKEELDLLCASGEVMWIGRKEEGEKEGRIAFFQTDAKPILAPFLASPSAPSKHPELLRLLERKGASFLTAIARETGMLPSEALEQLMDLVWEGRAANDQFAPLRPKAAARRAGRGDFHSGLGRWYALSGLAEGPYDADKSALVWAQLLLERHLIVNAAVAAESPFPWDALQGVLRKLEEWGMLVRGFFVRDAAGIQFARKEDVERLRLPFPSRGEGPAVVSAVDPANPFGTVVPWPADRQAAFARKTGNVLVLQEDSWVLWVENNGRRLVAMDPSAPTDDLLRMLSRQLPDIFRTMLKRNGLRKIVVELWNGRHAAETEAGRLFEQMGAEKDRKAYVLWPSALK